MIDHATVCLSTPSADCTLVNCLGLTDKDGHFDIEHAKPGTYGSWAPKKKMSTTLRIKVPESGGLLIGSVKDKAAGNRLNHITVT